MPDFVPCHYPFTTVNIGPGGDVWFCCPEWTTSAGKTRLGSIMESSLTQLWNGETARAIRRAMYANDLRDWCRTRGCPILNGNTRIEMGDIRTQFRGDLFHESTVDDIRAGRDHIEGFPAHLIISNDWRCNLRCVMCDTTVYAKSGESYQAVANVTDRIFEVDRGEVQSFAGNYAYYLEKKAEQEELRAVEGHKREQLIKKELAWLRRGAKARTRKSKHRIEAAHALMAVPKEQAKGEVDIAIGSKRLGSKVIEINGVSRSYGDNVLIDDLTYLVKRDDRIGIIGANGSGKTTLLDMITGRVAPSSGNIEIGQTVHIGYYDQESRALNDEQREFTRTVRSHGPTAMSAIEYSPVIQSRPSSCLFSTPSSRASSCDSAITFGQVFDFQFG